MFSCSCLRYVGTFGSFCKLFLLLKPRLFFPERLLLFLASDYLVKNSLFFIKLPSLRSKFNFSLSIDLPRLSCLFVFLHLLKSQAVLLSDLGNLSAPLFLFAFNFFNLLFQFFFLKHRKQVPCLLMSVVVSSLQLLQQLHSPCVFVVLANCQRGLAFVVTLKKHVLV